MWPLVDVNYRYNRYIWNSFIHWLVVKKTRDISKNVFSVSFLRLMMMIDSLKTSLISTKKKCLIFDFCLIINSRFHFMNQSKNISFFLMMNQNDRLNEWFSDFLQKTFFSISDFSDTRIIVRKIIWTNLILWFVSLKSSKNSLFPLFPLHLFLIHPNSLCQFFFFFFWFVCPEEKKFNWILPFFLVWHTSFDAFLWWIFFFLEFLSCFCWTN